MTTFKKGDKLYHPEFVNLSDILTEDELRRAGLTAHKVIDRCLRCYGGNNRFARNKLRPVLISRQGGLCPVSGEVLINDGKQTEIDHIWAIWEASDEVLRGKISLSKAKERLWSLDNLRAVTKAVNQARINGRRKK